MTEKHFRCEDCGLEFAELEVDVEDEPLSCPECGGLDIQLLSETESDDE
jgi:putative FmdB family regulatory protein